MIIDVHCHIWKREWLSGELLKVLESVNDQMRFRDRENVLDGSPERLIAAMDEAGIDKTVLLPLDYEILYTGGALSFKEYNDFAAQCTRRYPHRLIAFAGVDPRRGAGAVVELRRCVEDLGFRGLKLWTVTGFVPDDEAFYPLYEEAARLAVAVMVHTGMGPADSYLKTCRPVYVDKIAVDFREIPFVMAHVGAPWTEEALAVAMKNANVYVDVSAWQKTCSVFPLAFSQLLSLAKALHGGVHKILFGSDWPLFTELFTQRDWVGAVEKLEHPAPLQVLGLPEITREDKARILGENARELLRL